MSPTLVCVTPDLDLQAVAADMVARSISGCPVVDEGGVAVGFLSKTDLLCAWVGRRPAPGARRGSRRARETTVGDVMTPVLFSIRPEARLPEAVALLAKGGVHHLVVIDGEGRAVGVLSVMDVIRHLARR